MIRHFKFLDYALSSLLRRRWRSLAIFSVFTLIVTLLLSVLMLSHALRTETVSILEGTPDLIIQRTLGGRHELIPLSYMDEIKKILGVSEVSPRYWGYYYDGLTDANYTIIGVTSGRAELEMIRGRLPRDNGECAVGVGISALRGVRKAGELILVNSNNVGTYYTLTGTFSAESRFLTNDLVILTDGDVIRLFGYPDGMATDLVVVVPNDNEIQTVATKIKRVLPDSRPITRREIIRTYDMVLNWRSGMMLAVFAAASIAFFIMAWDKAAGISGEERREIGILKAIGWSTTDVLSMKFWEAAILSLSACLTGTILSFIHIYFLDGSLLALILKGWSVLFPPLDVVPVFDVMQLLVVCFFTVVPYIASSLVPAWKTSITDPESVMR